MKGSINFFTEDVKLRLEKKSGLKAWIKTSVQAEKYKITELNFVFCSDLYLLEINKQFLNHSTFTDVITFDNAEDVGTVSGDIYISIDRVSENAFKFGVSVVDEIHRVMIHGVLHLLGYKDKPKKNKLFMTEMENKYLALRNF